MKVTEYDPATAIPSLEGKVILVTGGTSGFGYETVLHLAPHGAQHIIFTGRNHAAAAALITATGLAPEGITFLPVDMCSLASVKALVDKVLASFDRLDVLIENAALGGMATESKLTEDGYEPIFGTNYVAHALLSRLLLPLMDKTAARSPPRSVRLICVSSAVHLWMPVPGIDYASLKAFTRMSRTLWSSAQPDTLGRYCQSKLANILLADEVARRHPGIVAVSLHPGIAMTEMNRRSPWWIRAAVRLFTPEITPAQGAYNQLWAATTASDDLVSGGYYDPVGVKGERSKAASVEAAKALWVWTEGELQRWL